MLRYLNILARVKWLLQRLYPIGGGPCPNR